MDLKKRLTRVGFYFEKIDEQSISIIGIPPECQEENLQTIIESLIEQYKNNDNLKTEGNKKLAFTLANSLTINGATNKELSVFGGALG